MGDGAERSRRGLLVAGLVGAAMLGIAGVVWRIAGSGDSGGVAARGTGSGGSLGVGVADVEADRVFMAAGEFEAGCHADDQARCFESEKPARRLQLDAFSIDRTEVSVATYRDCVAAGVCSEAVAEGKCNFVLPGHERHPINCVDWHQAEAFCSWRGGRLPTELEWERAARGTTGDRFPWGDAPVDCTRAVIDDGSGNACGSGDTTLDVGSRPAGASAEGVLDLIGNVWEWTSSAPENSSARIVRGGAYYVESDQVRVTLALPFAPHGRADFVGFRCAQ